MRHLLKGRTLGRRTEHRLSMYRNLAVQLIKNEQIKTTEAKAKEIKPVVEKLITQGKKGDLHNRRLVTSFARDKFAVTKLFEDLASRYQERMGGYTRMVRIGYRKGDAAPMVVLELVN